MWLHVVVVSALATRRDLRQILAQVQARADAASQVTWDISVDSTIARAHQHAAGARKRGTAEPSRPTAGVSPSRPTTGWDDRVAG